MIWGLASNSLACVIMSIPPTIVIVFRPSGRPTTRNCSDSWYANSLVVSDDHKAAGYTHLVGVRTIAQMPYGSRAIRSTIGKAKAIVLPLPVLAPPMQSRPADQLESLDIES